MRKGPIFHGALLVAALAIAYQTHTRSPESAPQRAAVPIWGGTPDDVVSLLLEADKDVRSTKLERRSDAAGRFLWGTVSSTATPAAARKPPPPDAGPPSTATPVAAEEPAPVPTTTVREFLLGEEGVKLFDKLAPLMAVRDLGVYVPDPADEFGLANPRDRLTVVLKSGPRVLQLGKTVYGGADRYALDPASQHVYVLPADLMGPLATADSALREKKLHAFEPSAVSQVKLSAGGKERLILRKANPDPAAPPAWAPAATPDQIDQTLANFMGRLDRMAAVEYAPALQLSSLTAVLFVEYQGARGEPLGKLELYRDAASDPAKAEYYVFSERTRVLAKAPKSIAASVEQDVAPVLGP